VTFLSNVTQIFFAVNDNTTAEYVSTRLGEQTIIVESGGTSEGTSRQSSSGPHSSPSITRSWNENREWNQQARQLLKPEEVQTLPPRLAITFAPGVRPILTSLIRYYEEKRLGRSLRLHGGALGFVGAAVRCVVCLGFAVFLTAAAVASSSAPPSAAGK